MTYDPIFELETDYDNDNIVPYELIITNWLRELMSLTHDDLIEELLKEEDDQTNENPY
jgi:hypothetical protein